MTQRLDIALLIDHDEAAAHELAQLLQNRQAPPRLFVMRDVSTAADLLQSEPVDWLFIRITLWDDYQQLAPSLLHTPGRVVFLSGRNEKCTGHLGAALDAHLQPPYRAGYLAKVWNRLSDPQFVARPLDILFVKSQARYEPVRYCDLRQVTRQNGQILIETRDTEYLVAGSLQAFQDRLPTPLSYASRGCLINEKYQTNWWPQAKSRQSIQFRIL